MDQFGSMFGKKDHAIILDCSTMKFDYLPLELIGYKPVLLNSKIKHSLNDSAYNERRARCEQGLAWVKEHYPNVNLLCDVDLDMLKRFTTVFHFVTLANRFGLFIPSIRCIYSWTRNLSPVIPVVLGNMLIPLSRTMSPHRIVL